MKAVNYFYSLSQLFATLGVVRANLEGSFFVLFPIQLAAFLLTLVRKHIIAARSWHIIYFLSLAAGYVYLLGCVERPHLDEIVIMALVVFILRFGGRVNKYLLWVPLAIYIATRTMDNAECDFLWSSARYERAFLRASLQPLQPAVGTLGACSVLV
jgi:hypothetical protein